MNKLEKETITKSYWNEYFRIIDKHLERKSYGDEGLLFKKIAQNLKWKYKRKQRGEK